MENNSDLNNKYFIDSNAFNCPFCKLRNATYTIVAAIEYDINNSKKGCAVFVECNRCHKISLHFIYSDSLATKWSNPKIGIVYNSLTSGFVVDNSRLIKWDDDIDSKIFHSIPSSYFTMDERIPKEMRELFDEAQECQKANLKTGASACLRKLIYTLLSEQLNKKAEKTKLSLKDLGYEHYSDCIAALKEYHPELNVFIEPLEDITGITSDQVHEDSWAKLSSNDLNICLASIRDLLDQIYVQPALLQERRNKICEMRNKAKNKIEKNVLDTGENKNGK